MFKLVIQDDEGKTTVVPLIRDEITIGRKEGNTIRLTERNVSRRHARILRNNGEVQIEDLGSYNGIRVNNARIAERVSLRVSDQVQIGDYKLYLKAEGVEQVDDARTMPIERVDSQMNTAPTDVIPTVAPAPTQPMGVPTTPVPGRLVGDPNRTLVSVADTDPQGRPVASAAAVAAMSSPVGYGKLVVLSSNFAGKEFELSRPQMIIGRTDENDIVVNHRSISRNHAKLVREPETGRYTISDLQSSNGVRVNGQDYGKVELRRGDVIDLGHVRLRFVEPGEDFVFARDAVITDVPDIGGRRSVLFVVLAVVVLAAIAAVIFWIKSGGNKPEDSGTANPGSQLDGSDKGSQVAILEDAPAVTPPPQPEIDAAVGSAAVKVPVPPTNDHADQRTRCLELDSKEKWQDLLDCVNALLAQGGKDTDGWKKKANTEILAEPRIRDFDEALRNDTKNLRKAKTALDQVQASVYFTRLKTRYEAAENASVAELARLLKSKLSNSCREWGVLVKNEVEARGQHVVNLAKARVPCQPKAVTVDPCKDNPTAPGCPQATPPPPPTCVLATLLQQGTDEYAQGSYKQALATFEAAEKCKGGAGASLRAFMAACKIADKAKAKYFYRKAPTEAKKAISICVGVGISEADLDAPP